MRGGGRVTEPSLVPDSISAARKALLAALLSARDKEIGVRRDQIVSTIADAGHAAMRGPDPARHLLAVSDHVVNPVTTRSTYPYTPDGGRRWGMGSPWPESVTEVMSLNRMPALLLNAVVPLFSTNESLPAPPRMMR